MSDQEWNVIIDGEQQGPFSRDEVLSMLHQQRIDEQTLVRLKGADDWCMACDSGIYSLDVKIKPMSDQRDRHEMDDSTISQNVEFDEKESLEGLVREKYLIIGLCIFIPSIIIVWCSSKIGMGFQANWVFFLPIISVIIAFITIIASVIRIIDLKQQLKKRKD